MNRMTKSVAAITLALSLAVPLAACGGQTATTSTADTNATEQATLDVSSWKTLGDAMANYTENMRSASWDDEYFVTMFDAGDSVVRIVAKNTPAVDKKLNALDASNDDYEEQYAQAISGLEILEAKDVTDERLSQDELNKYVGKTGKDLMDAGFTFSNYNMYGGGQTGATMDNGYFSYNVTFDVSVPENNTEDEGESIKDATVVSIEAEGASNAATELPTK